MIKTILMTTFGFVAGWLFPDWCRRFLPTADGVNMDGEYEFGVIVGMVTILVVMIPVAVDVAYTFSTQWRRR